MGKKRKFSFKKTLRVYIVFLILLTILATIYVINTLKTYEKNQIENYIQGVINDLQEMAKKNKIQKKINHINAKKSEFEQDGVSIEEGLNELFKSNNEITYKLNKDSKDEIKPVYDIYVNNNKILEVALDGTDIETKLSLLTYSKWKTNSIDVEAENGLLDYEISIPSNYKVYINNKQLTEDQISSSNEDKGLIEISKYVEIPYLVKYEVKGLIRKPVIKIVDSNGKEKKSEDIKLENNIKEYKTISEARQDINNIPNIMEIAENWSLFLSNDLKGSTHGFYTINKYLIKDSELYKYAYKWATNVDITFISNHTLKDQAFTNEEVSNFKIYNENAFSCEVYLDKNMRLSRGTELTDTMHEKMFFAYYDDTDDSKDNPTWKLVNMQSITKNK